MSAKHVLLGFLLQRSSYPYELGDRLVQRLGPGWKVNSGQLSQEIKRMEQDGLIEPVGGAGAGTRGPKDRHVYRATASGAAGVRALVRTGHEGDEPLAPAAHGQAHARRSGAPE